MFCEAQSLVLRKKVKKANSGRVKELRSQEYFGTNPSYVSVEADSCLHIQHYSLK